jgi:hypothetical protein
MLPPLPTSLPHILESLSSSRSGSDEGGGFSLDRERVWGATHYGLCCPLLDMLPDLPVQLGKPDCHWVKPRD